MAVVLAALTMSAVRTTSAFAEDAIFLQSPVADEFGLPEGWSGDATFHFPATDAVVNYRVRIRFTRYDSWGGSTTAGLVDTTIYSTGGEGSVALAVPQWGGVWSDDVRASLTINVTPPSGSGVAPFSEDIEVADVVSSVLRTNRTFYPFVDDGFKDTTVASVLAGGPAAGASWRVAIKNASGAALATRRLTDVVDPDDVDWVNFRWGGRTPSGPLPTGDYELRFEFYSEWLNVWVSPQSVAVTVARGVRWVDRKLVVYPHALPDRVNTDGSCRYRAHGRLGGRRGPVIDCPREGRTTLLWLIRLNANPTTTRELTTSVTTYATRVGHPRDVYWNIQWTHPRRTYFVVSRGGNERWLLVRVVLRYQLRKRI